ncbi:hypothetical protein Adeg_0788 [Ammonifex degensii KC4]|uniref:Uncharacterized protein n=1 Tax=Ammonifex degensii (strain DSM 10501 / KC4) TaxID=429009 RepID=C9RCF4_AMMDK|nr:hypothetical protein [Ammonifex degensii]ACX51931.1 hypothetical protein Adeg_0788 [Ammonifex degensii KC4]
MRFRKLAAAVLAALLAASLLLPGRAGAETATLVERNGEEVTVAEGYWKLLTSSDGKQYRVFFLTAPAVSSKGRRHAPPEAFVDTSRYENVTVTEWRAVTSYEEAVIRSPLVQRVEQERKGSGRVRVQLLNDSPYAGERVRVEMTAPARGSGETTLAAGGGTGSVTLDAGVNTPGFVNTQVKATVVENLDPLVRDDYRYPQGLDTAWQGQVYFDFYAPGITLSPSGAGLQVAVRNPNEVRGQIQVYYEMRRVRDGSLVSSGFLSRFGDPGAWWNAGETRTFSLSRPPEAYQESVRVTVGARYGNDGGPRSEASYTFEVLAPGVSLSDQGSYVRVYVTNRNNFGGYVRVSISHDGTQIYLNTFWMGAGGSWSYDVQKKADSGGTHTVSAAARFNPENGPVNSSSITYQVLAPGVSLSDYGSYVRVYVTNRNNFGGYVRVSISHDGTQIYLNTFWMGAGSSWSYDVTKKKSSGWHTVSAAARFNPENGPKNSSSTSYYVESPPPPYVYTSGGTVYVYNPSSEGGWFRVWDDKLGYLAGGSSYEARIGPHETWSYYVGNGHSGAFKGWNYDYSRRNASSWST